MKIGIISSYAFIKNNNNYGALLQYYALQTYLKKMGHEPYWIRSIICRNTPTNLLRKLYHLKSIRLFINWIYAHRGFQNFVKKYLKTSQAEYLGFNAIKSNPPEADVYITGSDQVWGNEKLKENYLLFVPPGKKKIAYAASFGKNEISESMEKTIKPWLENFTAISVRESSGVDICRKMGIESQHLIDPTLLINDSEYPSSDISQFKKPYIFCYFLNVTSTEKVKYDQIKTFAYSHGLDLHICAVQGSEKFFEKKHLISPTPEEWLTAYRHAKYIVTNTFHGSVFALIHHKPFAVLLQDGNTSKQNSRLTSLLNTFSMNAHFWSEESELNKILAQQDNWSSFESIKKSIISKTDSFFDSYLKGL